MKESILLAGTDYKLHGLVAEPDTIDTHKPAVIFLNSGLMHHIGTCRTSVIFSRALAENNILCARFDFSGIGDTPSSQAISDDQERVVNEVKVVMDTLQKKYGINTFILYGLCSGARNSFSAALEDDRVVGLFGIDNQAYRTVKYYWNQYAPRLTNVDFWLRHLKSASKRLCALAGLIKLPDKISVPEQSDVIWGSTEKSWMEQGYQTLVDRDVKLFQVYTGNWDHEYNYEKQFYDMFPSVDFKRQLTVLFRPEMSHIMAEPSSQELLTEQIVKWANTF